MTIFHFESEIADNASNTTFLNNKELVGTIKRSNNIDEINEITSSVRRIFNLRTLGIALTVAVLSSQILSDNHSVFGNSKPLSQLLIYAKPLPKECGLRLSQSLQMAVLEKHNKIRSDVAQGIFRSGRFQNLPPASKMPRMDWDCELESEAQERASTCDLNKIDKLTDREQVRGENAFYYQMTDSSEGILKGIDKMAEEISNFELENAEVDVWDTRFGHATQIIWEQTTKVGCAVQECPARKDGIMEGEKYTMAVCKYYPSGNVIKLNGPTKIYSVGVPGSECGSSNDGITEPTTSLCIFPEKAEITKKNAENER